MKKNGFTLLEVIIGIAILTIAVAGVMGLMTQTLAYASSNQSKLIASYLAQEGLELVRNIRDDNWLRQRRNPTSVDWKEGLNDWLSENFSNEIDYTTTTLKKVKINPPQQDESRYLYISSTTGFYYYPPGPPPSDAIKTSFKRLIWISNETDSSFTVTVLVSWQDRGKTYNVEAETILYNWYGA